MSTDNLKSVKEVSKQLGVSPKTVYALVEAGKLKCYRIGVGRGTLRFDEAQIDEYLLSTQEARKKNPTPIARVKLRHIDVDKTTN